MDTKKLEAFRELLLKNKKPVSEIECTRKNYDSGGRLIKESLPTITTDFCEIGIHNGEMYFVFVIISKKFNLKLFNEIKNKNNVNLCGLIDFNKTLTPGLDFNNFFKLIQKEKYLQIQFNYKNTNSSNLLKEYLSMMNLLEKSGVTVINQLKIDLTKIN